MYSFRDHVRQGSYTPGPSSANSQHLHSQHPHSTRLYHYESRRTECPSCKSRRSFSQIVGEPGKGKCFRCGVFIKPIDTHATPIDTSVPAYEQIFVDERVIAKSMEYFDHIGMEFYYDVYARQERAAIYEYLADIPREQAELMAGLAIRDHMNDESFAERLRELYQVHPFAARLVEITGAIATLNDCLVGLDDDGATIYWYRDIQGRVVNGKRVYYHDFHRDKSRRLPHFVYSSSHGYGSCLFGEEQLAEDHMRHDMSYYTPDTLVYLVESEKTAIIGRYLLPHYIWLATGGSSSMTQKKAEVLRGRTVRVLFDQDAAGEEGARKCSQLFDRLRIEYELIDMQNVFGERMQGFDLADHFDHTTPTTLT